LPRVPLKNLHLGGFRTRIFCSSGGCDDHSATQLEQLIK
jgi:hypothetical protein